MFLLVVLVSSEEEHDQSGRAEAGPYIKNSLFKYASKKTISSILREGRP
jgi:hypothetical protein